MLPIVLEMSKREMLLETGCADHSQAERCPDAGLPGFNVNKAVQTICLYTFTECSQILYTNLLKINITFTYKPMIVQGSDI